jgi:DNA-binding NarL/FixJ family response regulator
MHGHTGHRAQELASHRPQKELPLSSREIEVAILLAKGFINKEIADRLNISITTVITHRKNIMEKLHARSLADIIVFVVMNGLVEVGEL